MKTNKLGFFPIPKHLCLLLILLMANLVFSQTVWDGTADTDWYNDTKTEFTITTAEQLAGFRQLVNVGYSFSNKTITLGNDIVLNDTIGWEDWNETTTGLREWTAIGRGDVSSVSTYTPFGGTFNGNGYVVSGVYINTTNDDQGLFGYVYNGTVKNIGVEASYIKGGGNTGGLVGYQYNGTISNSYVIGSISGSSSVGGLLGHNLYGTIKNSFASRGGLIGQDRNGGGTIIHSYYDSQASGRSDINKGVGKTTEEMQSEEFVNILNITAYSLSMNAWVYSEGKYPALSKELATAPNNIGNYFASGEGKVNNPYIIKTKEQLENFSWLVNLGKTFNGEYIELGNDIALNDTIGWQNWNESTTGLNSWTAIGTLSFSFQGNFDGKGNVISGVYINAIASNQGLFGYIGSDGTIKNLVIESSYIKGYSSVVGGLVGYNGGTVSNCYATGTVSGNSSVVGGLVGSNGGTVSNSYSTGVVSGSSYVGGLVGSNSGTVSNSYSTGVVSGSSYVGGLVGNNNGTISNSYYDRQTSGQSDVYKGIPKTTEEMQSEGFTNMLNIGAYYLSMNAWIYSASKYPALSKEAAVEPNIGDYLAGGKGTVDNPYIIKTKEQLEIFSFIVNAKITFNGEYIELGNDIALNDTTDWQNWESNPPTNEWTAIGISPSFSFQGNFDGKGNVISGIYINTDISYQGLFGYISSSGTITNLMIEASYINGGSYVGGLVGQISDNIINSYFAGTVSGGSYVGGLVGKTNGNIINSYSAGTVSGSSYVGGLVGEISGNIANSKATGAVTGIISNYDTYSTGGYYIGGLVGYQNIGTIFNSNATGSVSGSSYVGGLAGRSNTVRNSYATGDVTGTNNYVGGLAGHNYGVISNSYAMGNVSGYYYSGGFAGYNSGTISNCYSIGTVSGISGAGGLVGYQYNGVASSSYYNSQTSDQSDVDKGIPKITEEMKTQSTYEDWDFSEIWGINSETNEGYPYLQTNYAVIFNANGGSNAPELQIKTQGATLVLSSDEPTRTGYSFSGWNTQADGGGTDYTGGDIYAINAELTLYAQWIPNTYTVTFNANGGSNVPEAQTKVHGVTLILSNAEPTREGYVFSGWNTQADGGGSNYAAGDYYYANAEVTLYANWIEETEPGNGANPIRIPQIASGQIGVKAINGGILLENLPSNAKVELFNLQGKQVYLGNSGNSQILQILIQTKGMYILKTEKIVQRVIVK